MKKSLILIILVIAFFSCKKDEVDYPDRIILSGIVSDTSGLFLSNVRVTLEEQEKTSGFGMYLTRKIHITDSTGKFKFEYNQNKTSLYLVSFSKKSYSIIDIDIDRSKEYQYFEVTLNSFIPRTFPGQP